MGNEWDVDMGSLVELTPTQMEVNYTTLRLSFQRGFVSTREAVLDEVPKYP